jgi:FKBP-type peptidyl-prolyl cis-trans isomerase
MKKLLLLLLPVIALVLACNSGGQGTNAGSGELKTFTDTASYAQGVMMAKQIQKMQVEGEAPLLSTVALKMGMDAVFGGTEDLFTEEELLSFLNRFQTELQASTEKKQKAEGAANRVKGEVFLAENGKKEGVITTTSGLQYKIITPGAGASPTTADKVEVNYEGRLLDGTVFDASAKRGVPAKFAITAVIKGWTEGVQLMKEGAKFQFYIPADLAYGDQGSPPNIAPGETLIFDVELLKVNP